MRILADFMKHSEDTSKEEVIKFKKLIETVHEFGESIQGYNVELNSKNTTSHVSKRFYVEQVTMAAVLDSFLSKNEIDFKELNTHVFNYVPKQFLSDLHVTFFQNTILKMIRLGLITAKETENKFMPVFEITESGIQALQQQTFQSLASSSFYSYQTNTVNQKLLLLTICVLIVTVASVIVTILTLTSGH
jgi:hypothetical protein